MKGKGKDREKDGGQSGGVEERGRTEEWEGWRDGGRGEGGEGRRRGRGGGVT